MIEVKNLKKSFDGQTVLDGIDLSIEAGTIVALLGASGSGKSVLLRNIVGLMDPDEGNVEINGNSVQKASKQELIKIRDRLGMLFQDGALFDSMTVYENLAFPLREKTDLTGSEISEQVQEQLQQVEMADTQDKYPAELSGGMQKRVALARSLILDPDIIFFDEPTTGLDPLIANSILRLIRQLHKKLNFTAIIITHNFQNVFPIVQKVAMLYEGELVAFESPDTFMEMDHPAVKEFVTEALEDPLEGQTDG